MSEQRIALRELGKAWENSAGYFEELGGEVSPNLSANLFVPDASKAHLDDRLAFLVTPVTFTVPERAKNPNDLIFIVAKGRICISKVDVHSLRTLDFGTEVAYFRRKETEDKDQWTLDHVFGAHFDYADGQHGHPRFHAQMNDFDELKASVGARYRMKPTEGSNHMRHILRNSRLPSAQMDIFSFMLQVAADHLIHEASSKNELDTLKDLATEIAKLKGVKDFIPKIKVNDCARSVHWYG